MVSDTESTQEFVELIRWDAETFAKAFSVPVHVAKEALERVEEKPDGN